ncbi:MAG: oligosaccharide flippase family protein [Rhodothermaceae bacterium]|nr:oligosaccharide flippase family protein [Rhodothermaceae bacterium]MYF40068.1 oligosaccharide flippase family protein [Rhodothermaceae bacterium]
MARKSTTLNWLDQLFSTQGLRGPVLTLLSGAGIVMVIGYSALGIISRLYLPAEIGIGKYFVTMLTLVGAVASLRYEDALMLPKKDEDAAVLIWLSAAVMLLTAILLTVLAIWSTEIARFLDFPAIAPYLPLVPLTLVCMRSGKIAEFWLVRKRAFRHISAGHVNLTASMVVGRIGAGAPPINANEAGHIGGFIFGHVIASSFFIWLAFRRSAAAIRAAFGWRRMRHAAARYRRFALFSTPSAAIGAITGHLTIVLIPFFFATDVAENALGFYGMALAAIGIPISYIARSVAHPFFVSAAEAQLVGSLSRITSVVHRRLIMIGLFPVLAVMLAGPDFFELWLGTSFRQAGIYAAYIAAWLVLSSTVSPLTRVYDVTEQQRLDFMMALLLLTSLSAAWILGGLSGSIDVMLIAGGITGAVVRGLQLVVILRLARVPWREGIAPYRDFFVLALPGLALIGAALLLENKWITTGALILGAVCYFGLAAWREQFFKTLLSNQAPGDKA